MIDLDAANEGYASSGFEHTSGDLVVGNIESFFLFEPGAGLAEATHGERAPEDNGSLVAMVAADAATAGPERMPWWVQEGMSRFLASGGIKGGAFQIGALDWEVRKQERLTVRAMRAQQEALTHPEQTTFATVYLLRTTRPAQFADYLRRLQARERDPVAFAEAFPDLTDDQLTAAISNDNWQQPPTPVVDVPLAPLRPELKVETISPADVHALWAAVYLGSSPDRSVPKAIEEINAAEALEPGNVSAALLHLGRSGPERAEKLRALHAAHPDDPRVCRAALSEPKPILSAGERVACADRLIAAEPDLASAHVARGLALLELKKLPEVSAELHELDTLGHPSARLMVSLANQQLKDGACAEALATIDRASQIFEVDEEAREGILQLRDTCDAQRQKAAH